MTQTNQQLSSGSPGDTVKAPVMHTGDDSEATPTTPGPGRNREALGLVVIGFFLACWIASIVLAATAVVNWFTALRW